MSITEDYLKINEPLHYDSSVESYVYHEYNPIVGTNLNNVNSEIRIIIENQDLFLHVANSYLLVKGKLVKQNDATYADADVISLINNAPMFLFSNIKYHLGDKQVDELNYPGFGTLMKGLLTYGPSEQPALLGSCWALDSANSVAADLTNNGGFKLRHSSIVMETTPKGSFTFAIPLKHIMGFFENYDKLIYGTKMILTLMRAADTNSILKDAAAGDGKVVLDNISWHVPHVTASDEQKLKLYNLIDRGVTVDMGFRHWHYDSCELPQSTSFTWRLLTTSAVEKPRWIILALQTDRQDDLTKNPAVFDHCNLQDAHVTLNSERYPFLDLNLNFSTGEYVGLYRMVQQFRQACYDANDLSFDPLQFKKAYPLVVLDCSKQSERLQSGIVDVQVKLKFRAAVPANTTCHALLIGDRKMNLKLDRGKVEVVY